LDFYVRLWPVIQTSSYYIKFKGLTDDEVVMLEKEWQKGIWGMILLI